MADPIATTLSLFSGVGGLDLGWQLATGARSVGYVERDSYAAAVLLARMEDQSLEPAPVWCGDICELPIAPFHGVDAIVGGFPCQDISAAGKGAGIEGERSGLWGQAFIPAIRELRPRYVFVENVGALINRGLDVVLGDLASLGYDTEWSSIRAGEVGAPHRRERIFILAHTSSAAVRRDAGADACTQSQDAGRSSHDGDGAQRGGSDVADTHKRRPELERLGELRQERHAQPWHDADRCGGKAADVGNADGARLQRQQCGDGAPLGIEARHAAIGLPGGAVFPPGPGGDWRAIPEHHAPAIEPDVRVLVDGMAYVVDASRADQLRCVGNGVVALQAAVAARLLLRRINRCEEVI